MGKLIERIAGKTVASLCWHLPSGVIDRRFSPTLADAPEGAIVTLTIIVDSHIPPASRRQPYKIRCHDETAGLMLVFFHAHPEYLVRQLPIGQKRVVSGRLERYGGQLQMTHPDYIATPAEIAQLKRVEPIYPMTAGLTPKVLGRAVQAAVARAPRLPEWIDPALLRKMQWPDWHTAIWVAHNPTSLEDVSPNTPARRRLAYDELLANQLALGLVRAAQRRPVGRSIHGDGRLRSRVLQALPYQLTSSQHRAIDEINADMARTQRMLRLLQGDVGSGKTVVALFAMLNAVEAGVQAAMLAPTEILARQHLATLEPLARAAGLPIGVLTGRDKGKARSAILAGLADGTLPLAVGTHALLQEDIEFKDLALAVVDEQHRFGVEQRLALAAKGRQCHLLAMTATPIPRTLMMTVYGDLDVCRLTEKPPGRPPVDTRTLPLERLEEVIAAVERAIQSGARVFWICPLVEESDAVDLAAAEKRYAELKQHFGSKVGLVHGRMKPATRDATMAGFSQGALDLLVATTVIEVGVDIPAASVMVIEHAERFGLAQLHQLRGRIGRGQARSTCLLLYQAPLGETARARLQMLRETEDGFLIAEEDLRLRGAGELLGTRQSGLPDFRLARLSEHANLIAIAHDDARLLLDRDPALATARGKALRTLLYLFERDAAVKTLRAA
jgi:ATP-dependent DNA helicase RecG